VRDRDGVVVRAPRREVVGKLLRVDGLAPLDGEAVDLQAKALGDGQPALGERAARRYEEAAIDAVEQRRLEQRRAGGGDDERVLHRAEQRPEAGGDAGEELAELRAAVADHRARHLFQNLGADPRRAGNEEVAHDEFRIPK
jgi:hypothetical protein